jgi:Helix-turn-helix domain
MSGRVFGYTFGRVPTWLLDVAVSDRSIRLFALLTRYADREGRGFPGRRTLAERLRCSVDSIDRALRELVDAGALRVEERWDVEGDGGRLTNDYYLLEHRDEDRGRTDARPPGRTGAAPPSRTGAAPPGRTGAAPPAAALRPLREREPEEREPGVNETPPSIPPPGGSGYATLKVIHPPTAQEICAAWVAAYRDRASQEPTRRAARQLTREAERLLADRRPFDVVLRAALLLVGDAAGPRLLESRVDRLLMGAGWGRDTPGASSNPVDARIFASVRRAGGETR